MCGIAGAFSYRDDGPPVSTAECLRMSEHMRNRGPDGEGLWASRDQRACLVHRRLAIIDPTPDGAQPMSGRDGRYTLVFNGEIYNYRELGAELERSGVALKGHSDTEVLLQLFERHGAGMLARLRGMYAFAIWDAERRSLFLARDPFGIKPLYCCDDGTTFRFSSQVKALLAGGGVAKVTEPAGLVGYWIWGHVPEPWTLYQGIVSLGPGTWMQLDEGGGRRTGVFQSVDGMLSPDDASGRADGGGAPLQDASGLRAAVLDSVRHHLVADVPVGVFLSAGIDSATIAALAAECGGELRTVTLGFEEYRGTPDDETVLASEVARRCGSRHETVTIGSRDFEDALPSFIEAMDQPSIDGLNTWLVARAASGTGLKAALSGLGGDEFFGGYPSFRQVPRMRALARPFRRWPGLGRGFRHLAVPLLRRHGPVKLAGLLEYGGSWEGAYLLRRAVRLPWELDDVPGLDQDVLATGLERLFADRQPDAALDRHGSPRAVVSRLEATRYMRSQLLRDADWAGMAHSLEIRVPLVDSALARRVGSLQRAGSVPTKLDLAACARPPLPDAVVRRSKTGFTVPVRQWMSGGGASGTGERGLRGWQSLVARSFA